MNELVRLYALDGVWEVGGADRRRGIWPEDLACVWDDAGPRTANFTLKRDPAMPQPDLSGLTPIEIEKAAGLWEGFIDQAPEGDEHALSVEAIGWSDYGNDDVLQRFWVHDDLSEWADQRSFLDADLTLFRANGFVNAGDGGVQIGWATGTTVVTSDRAGVTLDLGSGRTAKRVVLNVTFLPAGAANNLLVRGHDGPNNQATGEETAFASADGVKAVTFTTPRRYVTIAHNRSGAGVTFGTDALARLNYIRVFAETAYEAGNVSTVKASTVLKDALPRLCPRWSQDLSGITDTILNFPHLAPTEPRTFREIVDAVNAPHGYVAKLERGRRFRFKPQPTVPAVAVGDWDGVDFRDTSKNSTRDIYNKAIGLGRDGAGRSLAIVRYASQQPGVGLEPASQTVPNPSFAVDATAWAVGAGALTRDAVVFDTSPASGKLTPAAGQGNMVAAFTGTFLAGVTYTLMFALRLASGTGQVNAYLGDTTTWTDLSWAGFDFPSAGVPIATWRPVSISWTPNTDRSGVSFWLDLTSTAILNIDSLLLFQARPTLLDRRQRIRAQAVAMPSQAIGTDVLEAFCDVFLQTHMRTPASGDLTVQGRAAVDYASHDPLDPFELGDKTGELVCLLNEIDPDSGRLGRDIPIASVSYTGNDETAKLALDRSASTFEKVVARFDLLAGGGR